MTAPRENQDYSPLPTGQIPINVNSGSFLQSTSPMVAPRQIFDREQLMTQTIDNESQRLPCDVCNQVVYSKVSYEIAGGSHSAAFFTCINGGWMGCFLIPYCFDDCKDTIHACPLCNKILAKRYVI
jgi:lipopolysaccharide-induced tumor necrosis factor-alpha factor